MKEKAKIVLSLILTVAVACAVTLVYAATEAPKEDIVINSTDVFPKKMKGDVIFSHTKHKDLKCTDCHHVFKDGKNVWKEGDEVRKCSACHKKKKEGKVDKLKNAFHKQCMDCHKKLKKEKKKTGPISCSKCHEKKKKK